MSHTLSYLQKRFAEVGLRPEHRHGQNFLIDQNLLGILVDRAQVTPNDVVLEVGTGTGALTAQLAERAAAVVTVEIDARLFQLASEELFGRTNVTMMRRDVLAGKHELDHEVVAAVLGALAANPGSQPQLVSNLPYSIATPLLVNLLDSPIRPRNMTVTIQKELADRITAAPGSRAYGAVTVWIQSQCRVEVARVMPPSAFWPRPRVHSAIVRIEFDESRHSRIADRAFFHSFVRKLFIHRRKHLRTALVAQYRDQLDKPAIDSVLADLGHAAEVRAEQLDVEAMLALAEALRKRLG